jgi:hypothetical protein
MNWNESGTNIATGEIHERLQSGELVSGQSAMSTSAACVVLRLSNTGKIKYSIFSLSLVLQQKIEKKAFV